MENTTSCVVETLSVENGFVDSKGKNAQKDGVISNLPKSEQPQDAVVTEKLMPYLYEARGYQTQLMASLMSGYKRYVGVWHRRAGKDKTALNYMIAEMSEKMGIYYYFFPSYRQGRKIIWDGIDPQTGIKMLDHFPAEIVQKKNEQEMKITLTNGSLFQIVGTDDYNSIMGTNPRGCVFSEFALQDPRAWDYIRPILRENQGWAVFIFTPRGRNHGYSLYKMALKEKDWYVEKLTIADTRRDDGTPVISEADIEKDRIEGMDSDLIQQEYYCSFEGSVHGAYYTAQLRTARKAGRITRVPYDMRLPVYTYWDLGINDSMSIWFAQPLFSGEIRIIDYLEGSGEGLAYYAKLLQAKPYIYRTHLMPHDVEVRELGTGKSRKDVAESFGIKPIETLKRPADAEAVNAGIEACRNILSRCWFDEEKCQRGLEALETYRKEYDDINKCFKNKPFHDWSSNGADAFRTLAMGFKEASSLQKKVYRIPSPLAA